MKGLRALAFALLGFAVLTTPAAGARDKTPRLDLILADKPAQSLSAYGLFLDARAHAPAPGVTRYDLNTALFSDYALKFRYVYTPPGKPARYTKDGVFEFPVGTVLVKTFAYPADMRAPARDVRFLETRLLIRRANGWDALPYVWNAAGTEARLAIVGAELQASWVNADGAQQGVAWSVPNKNQCKGCHALDGATMPIGPKARNLNRDMAYESGAENQLAAWMRLGHLDAAPSDAPKLAAFDDESAPIEARARAYLDINCGHCHNPLGPASNSGLNLAHEETDAAKWGVFKKPVAAGRGAGLGHYSIVPGSPDQSILYTRMASNDPGVMMPELGRTLAHEEALSVVRAWIAGLDNARFAP
jgi:uncharacterized repeat protein (TIGR03806 family)